MSQHYSDPTRAADPFALPDVEVFYRTETANRADGWTNSENETLPGGWFYCCLPDGEPIGPFPSKQDAISNCQAEQDALSDEEEGQS
jgi:hypothetical protein